MKLSLGLLAALASCAAAAQPTADVFILPAHDSSSSTTTPSLPRSLTRLLLLQRLAPIGRGPSIKDMPNGIESEKVVSALNQFGKTIPPLFADDEPEEARQLILMLEGMTAQQIQDTAKSLKVQPSFTILDPPSAGAHDKLVRFDFYNAGITNEHKCAMDQVTNPFEEECWSGKSTVAKYNVKRNPEVLTDLIHRFPKLASLAKAGEMETTVLLLPAVSESSGPKHWSDRPLELRRRQADEAEQVITSFGKTISHAMPTSNIPDDNVFQAPSGPIPACFKSLDSCVSATGNCSHQGQCLDKFASPSAKSAEVCFSCHCLSTRHDENGPLTHWAGPTCAKKDISVPFWLFAGFTLLMIGTLSLATSMLYSVGEEKLPGVIGAGVSKSK
ncbi:putative endoplasmic reticulum membrane [Cladobotryum mycophilum]|uniref:Endoplasmic reticulum membrane n=1 Tax=Cladobotryum mycophilum TaxID=491253 RepID=A0ABR0SLL3_9HYPO